MTRRFHPPGRLSVADLLAATGGRLAAGTHEGEYTLCTDTRELDDGAVFVALRGERFDGHDWVTKALDTYSAGAFVEAVPSDLGVPDGPVIEVPDTLVALGDVARAFLKRADLPVAAITGSVGKTTARAMLGSILEHRGPGLQTEGNFNNRIGVPLTVLGLRPEHQWVVLEMGMSEPGEIRELARIAEPRVRLITAVDASHLEFFESVEGIADAKGELFESAGEGDTIVRPHSAWFVERLPAPLGTRVLTFSAEREPAADVYVARSTPRGLEGTQLTLSVCGEPASCFLALAGDHQVYNAAAAAAAACAMGASAPQIAAGLGAVQLPGRRMRVEAYGDVTVLDDAYNANPASVAAALATLGAAPCSGRRIAILGDMLELGPTAEDLHAEVGRGAAALGIDLLVGTGPLMAHAVEAAVKAGLQAVEAPDSTAAGALVKERIRAGDLLLLKGSRGMRMEEALQGLEHLRGGA